MMSELEEELIQTPHFPSKGIEVHRSKVTFLESPGKMSGTKGCNSRLLSPIFLLLYQHYPN